MEKQKQYLPKGNPTDIFDKDAKGMFQSDLMNLAYDKHLAKQRNLLYIILIIICVLATVYVTVSASYKTYVVRVDNTTGQIELAGELKSTNYNPQEAEVKYFLSDFVRKIRTIPLDPILYKNNWNNAQHYLTPQAAQKLNNLIAGENQLARLGHSTTQIKIRSIQAQPGQIATYQVRWSEEEYNIAGGSSGRQDYYVALFSVYVAPPSREEDVLVNPLGLKIADLNYARESTKEN